MKKKGMTLVELIMAIAVLGIIMVFVATGMQPVLQSYGVQRKLNESKDIANNTLAVIKNEIRDAKGYVKTEVDPDLGCEVKITSGGSVISFTGSNQALPDSYYQGNTAKVSFSISKEGIVNVTVNVNGYTATGAYSPYKPGVAKEGSNSGLLCIKKEAPEEQETP